MTRLALMLTGLLGSTGLAAAGCPGHVGTVPGLKLSRTEPYVAYVYRQTPDGLTEMQAPGTVPAGDEILTLYPHPLVEGVRTSATGELAFDYAADPKELETLDRIGVWTSAASFRLNGREIRTGQFERRLIGTQTIRIGGCETLAWLVEARMDLEDDDGLRTVLYYAPALGVVVRSERRTPEGGVQQAFTFDTVEVLAE